jgi:hypothetical protein
MWLALVNPGERSGTWGRTSGLGITSDGEAAVQSVDGSAAARGRANVQGFGRSWPSSGIGSVVIAQMRSNARANSECALREERRSTRAPPWAGRA